jgi:hypothetical protein
MEVAEKEFEFPTIPYFDPDVMMEATYVPVVTPPVSVIPT